MNRDDFDLELAKDLSQYTHDPSGFMMHGFHWGHGDLARAPGPRVWQGGINEAIREHLTNPATRYSPCRIAVASGHGIGKSAEIAMLTNWGMSTCPDTKVVITAGTGTQLDTKTVPECQKWFSRAINANWWTIQATSIRFRSEKRQANWRTDFITWSDNNVESFSGLHNQGKRIIVIFDEASAIHDKIWETTDGALTDEGTEIIWLAFGNPTRSDGRFRECFGKFKHRWKTFQIDSRQVEGTNRAVLDAWVADYGEDSDLARVRVRGEFPRAGGFSNLISQESVAACRKFKAVGYETSPKILACDVARFGDDRSVIGLRQGRKFRILGKFNGLDLVQVAERLSAFIDSEKPDGTVIDGDGIGAGVVDILHSRHYGKNLFEFHGGHRPIDVNAHFNKRAECWCAMRDWLNAGAEIPNDPEIEMDLCGTQYGFSNKSQIQLEKKEDLKSRGLASPDIGDTLAMTFGFRIGKKSYREYDPMEELMAHGGPGPDAWMR